MCICCGKTISIGTKIFYLVTLTLTFDLQNRGFLKTELLWKLNFRDGPEAVRFSQIILY